MMNVNESPYPQKPEPLDPKEYRFWTPEPGRTLRLGPEEREVPLPQVPLPLHRDDLEGDNPTPDAIGRGLYDYLRRFPECPDNVRYAELLRDAFPHYLADLGSQIVMLEHKEVDAPYVRRKLAALQILGLLEPENSGLLLQLGKTCYELALMFPELPYSREYLLRAMGYLQRSLRGAPENPAALNYLAQIDYLFGDYPAAIRRWQGVVSHLENVPARQALEEKIARLETEGWPSRPLVEDLAMIGEAVAAYGAGSVAEARAILEKLEEEGRLTDELPVAEFYYLLGMCRGRLGEVGGAFEAFDKSLQIEPDFEAALSARDRILEEGRI